MYKEILKFYICHLKTILHNATITKCMNCSYRSNTVEQYLCLFTHGYQTTFHINISNDNWQHAQVFLCKTYKKLLISNKYCIYNNNALRLCNSGAAIKNNSSSFTCDSGVVYLNEFILQ